MRFSKRTNWPRQENQLSATIQAARSSGEPLIDLTVSNPTAAGLPYARAEILAAISSADSLIYRPEPFGDLAAREAVAAYYSRRGISVSADRVLLTASTSEAYTYLFKLLCDPGDRVLVPSPSYPLFDFLLDLADVSAAPYFLGYDGTWHLDRSFEIPQHTRAALIVSPNNPTGSCFDPADRAFFAAAARAASCAIVSDEVFADYTRLGHARASWIGEPDLPVFALNGLSKIAGLPQLKLGWIVIGGPNADEAAARLEIIADTFLSVGTPVQRALPRLLELAEPWQAALRLRIAENLGLLERLVENSPVSLRRHDGGWSAILDLPRIAGEEGWAMELLQQERVLVQPGWFFEIPGDRTIVLSLLTPPEDFARGVERIFSRSAGFSG